MKFTHPDYKNFHINFVNNGVEVVVTLNVSKEMITYLPYPDSRVFMKDKFYVYVLKSLLEEVNLRTIEGCYKNLLKLAMIHCREAKKKVLDKQIRNIKNYEKDSVQLALFGSK